MRCLNAAHRAPNWSFFAVYDCMLIAGPQLGQLNSKSCLVGEAETELWSTSF